MGKAKTTMKYLEYSNEIHGFGSYIKILVYSNQWDFYIVDDNVNIENIPNDKVLRKQDFISMIPKLTNKDIVHFPFNFISDSYVNELEKSSCIVMLTLHDTIPLIVKNSETHARKWYKNVKRAVNLSDVILTVSNNSKRDIIRFFGVNANKIRVVYQYSSKFLSKDWINDFDVINERNKLKIPKGKRIVVCQGNLRYHKNFLRTALALKRSLLPMGYVLVPISKKDTLAFRAILTFLGIKKYTYIPGYVDDKELLTIYKMADLFITATLYEGFGLTAIEAMTCGTAVITSDNEYAHELLGDSVYYVNPRSIKSIASGLMTMTDTRVRRMYEIEGAKQVKIYSKANYDAQMKLILDELLMV